VGEQLSAPLRLRWPPRWTSRQGSFHRLRHRRVRILDALAISPGHSRGRGRGESAKLFAVASFGQSRFDAPLAGAFSAPRMLTRRDPSRILSSLHRTVPTSDVLLVTPRHTRVGFRFRPMRFAAGGDPCGYGSLRALT
jgi:hypothetical protein